MKLPKVVYVMGPPGAGKGTQAEFLAQELGYHRFSTGDAFRALARQDSDLGRKVKETIDNGWLMPPEDAAAVVIAAVQEHLDAGRGLVFDGTPRTVKEAQMVDDFFVAQGYGRPLAMYLKVDKEDMLERNSKRQFCLDVDGDFPVVSSEDTDKCLELGGRVGTRPDDEPEKFATRWQEFMDQTYPVIEKYEGEGILHILDGKLAVPAVREAVRALIGQFDS